MKTHLPPDITKVLGGPKPTAREIDESYHRARTARGGAHADRLKPEDPADLKQRGNRDERS